MGYRAGMVPDEELEQTRTPQTIAYPGDESEMVEQPKDSMRDYRGSGLLEGRAALITGGDSGIGRAVAAAFAKEGADIAISYFSEHDDAERTGELVRAEGRRCVAFPGDLADLEHVRFVAERVVAEFGRVDVLVNNAAFQQPVDKPEDVTVEQWRRTFAVNIDAMFFMTQALLPHMPEGSAIINTASVTGLRGSGGLLDYSATKGAAIALTYALAQSLSERNIRVNAVAPGPVWTPLIPATFDAEKVSKFGADVPMGRPAEPDEIAPSYVFLASNRLSSYYSGEILAPVGGQTMPG